MRVWSSIDSRRLTIFAHRPSVRNSPAGPISTDPTTRGQDNGAVRTTARSTEGGWVIAYLSGPSTIALRREALRQSDRLAAYWVHPATGQRLPARAVPSAIDVTF